MKRDFQDGPDHLNIEPYPNPKPLSTERVRVAMEKSETAAPAGTTSPYGYVRNANLHPAAHTGKG